MPDCHVCGMDILVLDEDSKRERICVRCYEKKYKSLPKTVDPAIKELIEAARGLNQIAGCIDAPVLVQQIRLDKACKRLENALTPYKEVR